STSARNASAKPGARVSSLSAIDRLPEALDPAADLLGSGLQRGTIDDQPGTDVGDMLDHDQTVGLERAAGLDQIDDAARQSKSRGQFHRSRQLDAFRLHAPCCKMPACDLGVLGGDRDVAPA